MPLAWPPATGIVTVGKVLLVLKSPAGAGGGGPGGAAGAEVARPERTPSSVAGRPLSGIAVTCWLSMTCPTPVERVSITGLSALTVTRPPMLPTPNGPADGGLPVARGGPH